MTITVMSPCGDRVHVCLFQSVSYFLARTWEYRSLNREPLGTSKSTPKEHVARRQGASAL